MTSKKWDALTARLKSEAGEVLKNNHSHGMCIVTVHIALDAEGDPLAWVVLNGVRIEPSRDAQKVLLPLLSNRLR